MNIHKILDKIPYGTFAPFTPAHYIGMAVGAFVLVFVAAWFLVFTPNQEEKAKLEKQLDEANKTLAKYLAEGAQKEAITKEVAALYGTLLEKKRQMPLATEIPQLLQKIGDIGDFLSLDIVAYSLKPSEENSFYKSIPISLTIAGNYYKTAGFFDSLQNLLRLVNVTKFKMDVRPGVEIIINEEGEPEKEQIDILQTEISANAFAYIEGSEEATEAKK